MFEGNQAGVAKLGNGAGLRILFLVIQGFKSPPLHLLHYIQYRLNWLYVWNNHVCIYPNMENHTH